MFFILFTKCRPVRPPITGEHTEIRYTPDCFLYIDSAQSASICSLALKWKATRLLVNTAAADTLQNLISSSKGHIWYLIEEEEEKERLVLQKWAERTAAEGSVSISHSASPGQISTRSSLCTSFHFYVIASHCDGISITSHVQKKKFFSFVSLSLNC